MSFRYLLMLCKCVTYGVGLIGDAQCIPSIAVVVYCLVLAQWIFGYTFRWKSISITQVKGFSAYWTNGVQTIYFDWFGFVHAVWTAHISGMVMTIHTYPY
jgi:hypothetical protein